MASEPDTEALLAEADSEHGSTDVNGSVYSYCFGCEAAWPCLGSRLAAALRAATRRIADLEEMVDSTAARNLKVSAPARTSKSYAAALTEAAHYRDIAAKLANENSALTAEHIRISAELLSVQQEHAAIDAVREAALEEAAKRCEALAGQWEQSYTREASDANRAKQAMRDCAAAIRALAQRKA